LSFWFQLARYSGGRSGFTNQKQAQSWCSGP
jgi:hypothetical protein